MEAAIGKFGGAFFLFWGREKAIQNKSFSLEKTIKNVSVRTYVNARVCVCECECVG